MFFTCASSVTTQWWSVGALLPCVRFALAYAVASEHGSLAYRGIYSRINRRNLLEEFTAGILM